MGKDVVTFGCNFTPPLVFGPVISARILHQDRCQDNGSVLEKSVKNLVSRLRSMLFSL